MNTPNPKCSTCKCYWKPDETDVKSSGLIYKCCKKCRVYKAKYFEENEEKIKMDIVCGCGAVFTKRCKYSHEKTSERHKEWVRASCISGV